MRYLRECVPGSEILELTINHQLLAALGEIYERRPRVLGIACYIWNIEMVKDLLRLLPAALPDTIIVCGGPEVSYDTAAFSGSSRWSTLLCAARGRKLSCSSLSGCAR